MTVRSSKWPAGNLISSLEKDVSNSLRIDPVDKPVEPPATPAIEPPVTPTEPAAPTPQTFVEADTHAASEPLVVVSEHQPARVPKEPAADSLKDAKAS